MSYRDKPMKIEKFDLNMLVANTKYLRGSEKYEFTKDYLIEVTSSCNLQEALRWMDFYTADALECGMGTVNEMLRCIFIAAWDIKQSLKDAN
jgi:hypothetical protein